MTAIQVPGLLTFTIAILVFFTGVGLNRLIKPLQRWNIPEAVTGGMLAAVVTLLAYTMLGIEISFTLEARDMLLRMNQRIKDSLRYRVRHEEGTQEPLTTLQLGTGTCRDFAVLMMEALRSFGVATRFVTGYLYDDTSGTTRGGGSTHAWCNVYLPGAGWTEYDPTNGLVAGSNLIRVGVTRAAAQALPISGGFVGNSDDPMGMNVDVAVSAVPI